MSCEDADVTNCDCYNVGRAAMKMANIDAVLDFMFTNPKDRFGVETLVAFFLCLCYDVIFIFSSSAN